MFYNSHRRDCSLKIPSHFVEVVEIFVFFLAFRMKDNTTLLQILKGPKSNYVNTDKCPSSGTPS